MTTGDLKIVLTGAAPKRDGCKVIGYTKNSPNAKLTSKFSLIEMFGNYHQRAEHSFRSTG